MELKRTALISGDKDMVIDLDYGHPDKILELNIPLERLHFKQTPKNLHKILKRFIRRELGYTENTLIIWKW
jgi:hypothetical protein